MRNTYQPTPGELLVGNKLEQFGYSVYLPAKDKGVDLLAEKDGRFIRVQVKESRTYEGNGGAWVSWTYLTSEGLRGTLCDYFVFVVYEPVDDGRHLKFKPYYVVISPSELERRLGEGRPGKTDRAVYFQRLGDKLCETRSSPELDFTQYLDNWHLAKEAC